jgi:hypothetical protein
MTQQVQYIVDLKGAQEAQRELDRLNTAFDKNSSAALAMDKSIAQMERDIRDLNAAIAAGGPNVVQYKRALKDLQTVAAQGAAGTRNMGQAALEASRGIEDLQYGIGGIVNNIPSLVMALGGGAGLTAAISLGAVAMNQLVKNGGALLDGFGETKREAKAFTETIKTMADTFDGYLNKSLEKTKQLLKDQKQDLIEFGKTARELRVMEASMEVDAQQGRLRRAEAFADQQRQRVSQLEDDFRARMQSTGAGGDFSWIKGAEEAIMTSKGIADQLERRAKALKPAIESQKVELSEIRKINDALKVKEDLKKKEDELEKARNKKGPKVNAEAEVRALIAQQERQDELIAKNEAAYESMVEKEINILADRDQKISDQASKAFKQQEADRLKAQKDADRAREAQNKKTLDAIAKAEKKHAEDQAQMATQAVGIVAGASTQLVSDMISGQEHALERFGLSIMAQAGQALVSYGIQAIGRGVLEASNPITAPLAPASFAAGAGLVTAGVGLGGVAGGLGSLMGSAGGDGETKRTTRDPGASPRRGTGTSPGGPIVLNLTYGAAGPLPEDTARLISRELRTGAKRAGR